MIRDAFNRAFWACYGLVLVWGAAVLCNLDYFVYLFREVL